MLREIIASTGVHTTTGSEGSEVTSVNKTTHVNTDILEKQGGGYHFSTA